MCREVGQGVLRRLSVYCLFNMANIKGKTTLTFFRTVEICMMYRDTANISNGDECQEVAESHDQILPEWIRHIEIHKALSSENNEVVQDCKHIHLQRY